jgi:hypothetical protein
VELCTQDSGEPHTPTGALPGGAAKLHRVEDPIDHRTAHRAGHRRSAERVSSLGTAPCAGAPREEDAAAGLQFLADLIHGVPRSPRPSTQIPTSGPGTPVRTMRSEGSLPHPGCPYLWYYRALSDPSLAFLGGRKCLLLGTLAAGLAEFQVLLRGVAGDQLRLPPD